MKRRLGFVKNPYFNPTEEVDDFYETEDIEKISKFLMEKNHVAIFGRRGAGKTSAALGAMRILNLRPYRFPLNLGEFKDPVMKSIIMEGVAGIMASKDAILRILDVINNDDSFDCILIDEIGFYEYISTLTLGEKLSAIKYAISAFKSVKNNIKPIVILVTTEAVDALPSGILNLVMSLLSSNFKIHRINPSDDEILGIVSCYLDRFKEDKFKGSVYPFSESSIKKIIEVTDKNPRDTLQLCTKIINKLLSSDKSTDKIHEDNDIFIDVIDAYKNKL